LHLSSLSNSLQIALESANGSSTGKNYWGNDMYL